MTTTTTAPTTFLLSLLHLLVGAGYRVSTQVAPSRNARLVEVEGIDGNASVSLHLRVSVKTGKVLGGHSVRTYAPSQVFGTQLCEEIYRADLGTAAEVVEQIGMLVATVLSDNRVRHDEDQPAPAAGDLVMYHGRFSPGVYRALGYTDREGRPTLRPVWASADSFGHDDLRVSPGCRSITPLPLP